MFLLVCSRWLYIDTSKYLKKQLLWVVVISCTNFDINRLGFGTLECWDIAFFNSWYETLSLNFPLIL